MLQVHAVSDPRQGLFDPKQARQWAQRWSDVTTRPFYLALPAYGVALLTQESGVPVVESEVPIDRGGERRELLADPQQVAGLAADLRADPPKHLAGLIWFRLPLAGDRRAWSLTTLGAVARETTWTVAWHCSGSSRAVCTISAWLTRAISTALGPSA